MCVFGFFYNVMAAKQGRLSNCAPLMLHFFCDILQHWFEALVKELKLQIYNI